MIPPQRQTGQPSNADAREEARAAWIRAAVARVIIDATDPDERDVVREALAGLGCDAGRPGPCLRLVADTFEGVA